MQNDQVSMNAASPKSKELEVNEHQLRLKAEAAVKARDQLLSFFSHELRNPLNSIQSWTHVLEAQLEQETNVKSQRALQGIRLGVKQQVELIENIIDVTRMLTGKLTIAKRPFVVLPVLQSAVESVEAIASAKEIMINTSYNIASEQIDGDPDRLTQIIKYLISSAISSLQEKGKLWLEVHHHNQGICIALKGLGSGLSRDALHQAFHYFQYSETSSLRGPETLSLSLSLTRYLVESHGGQVSINNSTQGKGAIVSIYLPAYVV